ncbi:MAG TPA: hypothetical protein VGI91_05060 [Steroidobacteraceae bacterium]
MRLGLAGILLLLAGSSGAQAHELLDRLDACSARLDRELDVGYERIAARCPELAGALTHSAWAPWLPADWNQPRNQLSAQGLTELHTLLSRSLAPSVPVRAPRPQTAAAVIARISPAEDSGRGWWGRFKAWLRKIMSGGESDSGLGAWLSHLDFPHAAVTVIAWLTLALVMAAALAILVNELRLAGIFKARRPTPRGGQPRHDVGQADEALDELERREPREQPALLLQLIAARLTEQGRLPPARALTARELLQGARLGEDSDRAALAELASASEQLRFSTRDFAATSLASAISAGRRMLVRLATPAPVPDAGTHGP